MSNVKLGLTNLVESFGVLLNGTGGSPARNEVLPYVMERALNSDRNHLWQATYLGGPIQYDIDLLADRPVTTGVVMGFRPNAAGVWSSIKLYSAPAAAPTTFTLRATFLTIGIQPLRDMGASFASVSARYWRFEFTPLTGIDYFSAGRLWVGVPTDLNGIGSPGSSYEPFRNRTETPLPSGSVVLAEQGDSGLDINILWSGASSAQRDALLAAHETSGSFLMIDPEGNYLDVYLKGGRVKVVRSYNNIFDLALEFGRRP